MNIISEVGASEHNEHNKVAEAQDVTETAST